MQEIEFRAKGLLKDRWYYGFFVKGESPLNNFIINMNEQVMDKGHLIDEDTLGQYTGRKDKNDKKIFDGDIICFNDKNLPLIVQWYEYKWVLTEPIDNRTKIDFMDNLAKECEIIGNIYDNLELLGV